MVTLAVVVLMMKRVTMTMTMMRKTIAMWRMIVTTGNVTMMPMTTV